MAEKKPEVKQEGEPVAAEPTKPSTEKETSDETIQEPVPQSQESAPAPTGPIYDGHTRVHAHLKKEFPLSQVQVRISRSADGKPYYDIAGGQNAFFPDVVNRPDVFYFYGEAIV